MAKDLNLALKKEVLESLQNGTTNEIIIEGSRWWKKRLMDLDTGKFKDFTVARVSSGSSDKVEYEIEKIEQRGENFVVTVYVSAPENTPVTPDEGEQPCIDNGDSDSDSDFDNEPIQYSDGAVPPIHTVTDGNDEGIEITGIKGTEEDLLKPDGFNPVTVETGENGEITVKMTYVKPITEITQKIIVGQNGDTEVVDNEQEEQPNEEYKDLVKIKDSSLKHAVTNLLNRFCELRDVYVVNMPNVTIRNNGQIFGCKKKLIADRESDVKFEFEKKEFVKNSTTANTPFLIQIMTYFTNIMKNNYVFINKNMCGFKEGTNGNLVFVVTAVAKRKYFFEKK